MCEVSARDGDGIENLIEGLLLQADVMELKAARAGQAEVSTILFSMLFHVALFYLILIYCSLYDIVLLCFVSYFIVVSCFIFMLSLIFSFFLHSFIPSSTVSSLHRFLFSSLSQYVISSTTTSSSNSFPLRPPYWTHAWIRAEAS